MLRISLCQGIFFVAFLMAMVWLYVVANELVAIMTVFPFAFATFSVPLNLSLSLSFSLSLSISLSISLSLSLSLSLSSSIYLSISSLPFSSRALRSHTTHTLSFPSHNRTWATFSASLPI